MSEVRDNPARSRFEMVSGDAVAFAAYRREEDRIVLTHTEVPEALSGRGVGSKLVRGVLAEAAAFAVRVQTGEKGWGFKESVAWPPAP